MDKVINVRFVNKVPDFKILSTSLDLYPRWLSLLKIEISPNGQNCYMLEYFFYSILTKESIEGNHFFC
jgi:hypothetical protein